MIELWNIDTSYKNGSLLARKLRNNDESSALQPWDSILVALVYVGYSDSLMRKAALFYKD